MGDVQPFRLMNRDRAVNVFLSRLAQLTITREIFLDILSGRARLIDGIPDDAIVLEVQNDFLSQGFTLVFQSQTFAPVPYGQIMPELIITLEWAKK